MAQPRERYPVSEVLFSPLAMAIYWGQGCLQPRAEPLSLTACISLGSRPTFRFVGEAKLPMGDVYSEGHELRLGAPVGYRFESPSFLPSFRVRDIVRDTSCKYSP